MTTKQPFAVYRNQVHSVWIVKWKAEDGKWRTKQVPSVVKDADDAKRWAEAWFPNRSIQSFTPKLPPLTMATLCARWVRHLREESGEEKANDADTVRRVWLEPYAIGKVVADELTLADCVRWVEALKRTDRAPNTIRNVVQAVRTMVADARGHGWVNPERPNHFSDEYLLRRMKGAQTVAGKEVVIHFSLAEALRIVGYRGREVPLRRHTKNVLAVCTGMRAAELSGLTWDRLDLESKTPTVTVDRQLTPELKLKEPKKGSFRVVPLHPVAVEALKRWRVACNSDEVVFPRRDGTFVLDGHARQFREDLKAYGVSDSFEGFPQTFHSLRRTFLTLLTDAGVHPDEVRSLAGHAAKGVTRRSYVAKHLERFVSAITKLPFVSNVENGGGSRKVISLVGRVKR